jgi:hypothetical protein
MRRVFASNLIRTETIKTLYFLVCGLSYKSAHRFRKPEVWVAGLGALQPIRSEH